jgi:hypothetical protein
MLAKSGGGVKPAGDGQWRPLARSSCDTPAMADTLCAVCSKPIVPTDEKSTVRQVDACTLAVEHVVYHAACRKLKPEDEAK